MRTMPPPVVFDVNETLLDLSALDVPFAEVFGTAEARHDWFGQVLQSALTTTVLDTYTDFSAIGRAALAMTAERYDRSLTDDERAQILSTVRRLPPHPDVPEGLTHLRDAGCTLVALSNGAPDTLHTQLAHADLTPFFEHILSADQVQRLKPAPAPYHLAADALGVDPSDMWFVAAHAWDIAGAMQVGCAAAFITRPGKVLDPLMPAPRIVAPDLRTAANRILATSID